MKGVSRDIINLEAVNTSELVNATNPVAVPYDLTLIDIDMTNYPTEVPAANEDGTR